ncbi:MAG: sensor histidine kinase [Ktedonobacterales bacterium]|nr:sensor histidine kinase [Ktedonobacterales bacterium]
MALSKEDAHPLSHGGWPWREALPRLALPVGIVLTLPIWVVVYAPLSTPAAPPGALLVLGAMSFATALAARKLRTRFGLDARAARALPDPLYMLYLATVILAGARGAIPLAIAASLLANLPDTLSAPHRLDAALRQAAAAGATTLAAAVAYLWVSAALAPPLRLIHAHLIAALAAALLMLVGTAAFRALERPPGLALDGRGWRARFVNPAFRFQALMLAIAPLLPLADVLDGVEAELAWVLFLVPLYAMYYLALLSARLERHSGELQRTVEELRIARRREAELTDYAALITRAQEEERRRLARDLHDDTAQALVALSRGLDGLSSQSHTHGSVPPAQDARFIEDLSDLAKRSLESIRRACQDLRPSVLDDLGLSAALASLATATTQRGLRCDFTQEGESHPCAPEVEVTIYRIAQEALANARRHAGADSTALTLAYRADALLLTIRDDGRGFADAAVSRHAHRVVIGGGPETRAGLGLLGMRERAALIGARLDIASTPGVGTRVSLLVRLPRDMLTDA